MDGNGIVFRENGHDAGPVHPGLGHHVGVRDARFQQIGAPQDQVFRIKPVGRFAGVGLDTPGQGLAGGQVAVPVIEAADHPAGQMGQTEAAGQVEVVLGRNGRVEGHRVRPFTLDGLDDPGGNVVEGLLPGGPAPFAFSPGPHADQGIFRPLGPVDVLLVVGPLLATPGIVGRKGGQRGVIGRGRIVGVLMGVVDVGVIGVLLFFEKDAVPDIALPGAGPRAVDPVGAASEGVVAPLVPVERLPAPVRVRAQGVEDWRQQVQCQYLPGGQCSAGRQGRLEEFPPCYLGHRASPRTSAAAAAAGYFVVAETVALYPE